jgi:hypothetical protein
VPNYVLHSIFEAFLNVATIKKTPVLKREELYQGLIEPGWGAGLLNPAQGGERNIVYMTPLTLNSFLYVFPQEYCAPTPTTGIYKASIQLSLL